MHALQAQYALVPLSRWGREFSAPPAPTRPDAAIDTQTAVVRQVAALDAARFFGRVAHLMADNPAAPADAPMLTKLASLGVVPGQPFRPEALSGAQRAGLDDAVWFVKALFESRAAGSQGEVPVTPAQRRAIDALNTLIDKTMLNVRNTWLLPLGLGRYETHYPLRALVALVGYGANVAEDAVYPMTSVDEHQDRLNGAHTYRLHFDRGQIPPADAFWSLTLYDDAGFFVDNPIGRYAIGDRNALHPNADGSLDLLVQHATPSPGVQDNWLPAPQGNFKLSLRLYNPRAEVLDGRWAPPPVQRTSP